MKDYILTIDGKDIMRLNPQLIERQQIGDTECRAIIELHRKKYGKLQQMKALAPTQINELRSLVQEVTELEFKLQDAWRFDRNALMHRFWELPHCTCPSMDNRERYGTDQYIISLDCPLHGE